jgi:hypothetical protein
MTVSDDFPSSLTSSFTLSITNVAPKIVIVPEAASLVHGNSLNISMTSNFADDDGDPITMIATYTLSGGAAVKIPSGIFTVPSDFTIGVKSTSIADTGVYTITLTVSDFLVISEPKTFIVTVTNSAPKI